MRTRVEALPADALARFRALTPVRVVGDVLVMVAVVLLDRGPWAQVRASGWLLAAYLVLLRLRHVLPATAMIGGAAIPFLGPR